MINQRRCIFGTKNSDGATGHVTEGFILIGEIVRAERMVQQMVRAWVIRVVASRHKNNGQAFGIRPGHAVKCRKSAHVESRQECSNAINTCVAFGRIRGIQFIAAANLLHPLMPQKLVEQNEIVVPRHHETVSYSNLLEPSGEVIPNGAGERFSERFFKRRGNRRHSMLLFSVLLILILDAITITLM